MNLRKYFTILLVIFAVIFSVNAQAQNNNSNEFIEEFDDDFDDFGLEESQKPDYDPLEPANRVIYVFNDKFDRYFFEHVAKTYRFVIPKKARSSIRNFLNNLSKPISFVNSLAQGKIDNSLATLSSFIINSTVGIFGLFDVADINGIKYNKEDFGQTLGHYGVGYGFYLVVPFRGPSSLRDISGWALDSSIDPLGLNVLNFDDDEDMISDTFRVSTTIMSAVDSRESLINVIDDIRKDSFDPYVTLRSAYIQNRKAEIKK